MRFMRRISAILALILLLANIPMNTALAYNKPYYIEVDLSNNITTVYSALDDTIVRQMICSSGMLNYPSPVGTFYMTEKRREAERTEWYTFEDGYGKYGSRIVGSYLFHSFLFTETEDDKVDWETYAAMGTAASHGCIRLYIEDAKWIADNCMPGTRVKLYHNDKRYEYLKELLYEETFTIDSGLTYEEFVCMASSKDELGYYSQGEEVKDLQERMIELGLYSGEADGFYNETMVRSVKAIQAVLGMRVTGTVNSDLLAILNSDDAPSSTISTLSEGMTGPAVRSLQQILAALGLYSGSHSGEYDAETIEAVKAFQLALGEEPTGVATASLQQDMLDSFAYLEKTFSDTGYALTFEEQIIETATIDASKRLNVRAKKSTDSTIVDRLDPGTEVEIVDRSDSWTKIRCGETEGYVRTSYLKITESTIQVPKYIAADAANPALPTPKYGDNVIRTRQAAYGVVDIEDRLRIREAPDKDAEIVFMLSPGNIVEVISVNEGWAYVSYGGKSGFTQAKYFNIVKTAELTTSFITTADVEDAKEDNRIMALVISENAVPLMSSASSSGEIQDYLDPMERAEVIFESTSWTQVRTDDMIGYINNDSIITGTAAELDEYIAENSKPDIIYAIVDTGSDATLNLRDMPSSEGNVLAVLENGTVLTVIEDDGEWACVEHGMYTGYTMSKYIVITDNIPASYPDATPSALPEATEGPSAEYTEEPSVPATEEPTPETTEEPL